MRIANPKPQSFAKKASLTRHYRIHTNERPYSCMTPGCGRKFIQKTGLTRHIRTHTGEKPYQCSGCNKRFSDVCPFHVLSRALVFFEFEADPHKSSGLARHRRIHIGKRSYKYGHGGCLKR